MATLTSRSIGNHNGYTTGYLLSSDSTGTVITVTNGNLDTYASEGDILVITSSGSFSSAFSTSFNTTTVTTYIGTITNNTHFTVQVPVMPNRTNMTFTINRPYSTITAWEAARPADLVASNIVWKGLLCNDGTAFLAGLNVASSINNDSTHYIWLTCGSYYNCRHDGRAYSTQFGVRIEVSSGQAIYCGYGAAVNIFENLQIKCTNAGTIGFSDRGIIRNCIVYSISGATAGIDVYQSSGSGSMAYNNLIYGGGSMSIRNSAVAYNNTIYGSAGYGFTNSSTNPSIYNNISVGSVTADYASGFSGSNNMSSDSSAPGTSSLTGKSATNQFQSIISGSENFVLRQIGDKVYSTVNSDAIGVGTSESGIFTTDARGSTRPATWDMGHLQHGAVVTHTIGTTGRDYSTISAWVSACPANLLTTCQIWKGVCYKDSVFNERVNMYGAYTSYDCFYYLTVAVGNRHTGKQGTGVVVDCANRGVGIECGYYASPNNQGYHLVEYFEVKNCSGYGDQLGSLYAGSIFCIFRNNLVYNTLGTINFSVDFITGNVISASVGGVSISPVTFTTSHANTATLLLAALNALPGVTATKDGTGHIYYINNFTLTGSVSGGASQPTVTILQGCGLYWVGGNGGQQGIWQNNLVYNMYVGSYGGYTSNGQNKIINNTITACTIGVLGYANPADIFINNIVIGNGTNWSTMATAAYYYNNLKDAGTTFTGVVVSGNVNDTVANTFNSASTYDFRIKSGSTAKGNALNESTIFPNDIINGTRTVPWDIGAYMYYTLMVHKAPMFLFQGRGIFQ